MRKHVFYVKGVTYSNTDNYEDTEIPRGYMTLGKFVDYCNKHFNQTELGNKYCVTNVLPMIENGRLNKRYGGNKLDIRRCNIPGVYHGVIIKVVGKLLNTVKRKKGGQGPKGKLFYYTHTNGGTRQ